MRAGGADTQGKGPARTSGTCSSQGLRRGPACWRRELLLPHSVSCSWEAESCWSACHLPDGRRVTREHPVTPLVTSPGPRKCRVLRGRHTGSFSGAPPPPGVSGAACPPCAMAGRGRWAEGLLSSDLFVHNGPRRASALQGRSLTVRLSRRLSSQNHRAAWDLCQAMTPRGLLRCEAPWGLLGADGEEGSCMDWPPLGPSARILENSNHSNHTGPGGGTRASSSADDACPCGLGLCTGTFLLRHRNCGVFSLELSFSDRLKKILDRWID